MKIFNPKRLPRKQKKWIIKTWGRKTYHGLMKGHIMLVPWIIVNEPPIVACHDDYNEEELTTLIKKEIKERYGEEKLKEIETRYATNKINENFYGKIKL